MSESKVLDQAAELLQEGDTLGAEALVDRAVEAALKTSGERSPQYAAAQFDRASVLAAIGDLRRGAEAMREACGMEVVTESDHRNRLTYLMNLGEFLCQIGEFDEAESVLREGTKARAEFYGTDHAGYAFGLEPLADVKLAQGDAEEAARLADEALEILWADGHPRAVEVIVLRALITKTGWGADTQAFDHLEAIPDDMLEAVAESCQSRAETDPPGPMLAVIDELVPVVDSRLDPETSAAPLNMRIVTSNLARMLGDHDRRLMASQSVIELLDRHGAPEQRVDARMGLALAHSDAGNHDAAEAAYVDASDLAGKLRDTAMVSQVQRNHGLYLAEVDRRDEATVLLRAAVESARAGDDPEMLGRAMIALGIFVQHGGDLGEAALLLNESLMMLPPDHPDVICARSHLGAIEAGGSCGCGDMDDALAQTLREMVLPHLPPGLLADIQVRVGEDGPDVQVALVREPTAEEGELLDRVLNQAIVKLQQQE